MRDVPKNPSFRQGERALAELQGEMSAIAEDAVQRPHTDPHGAAATALLVADSRRDEQLARCARALLHLVAQLGGEYLPDQKSIPGDLVQKGLAVRTRVLAALEEAIPEDAELAQWVEAVRLGSGVVDLVYDLRTVADVYEQRVGAADDAAFGAVSGARSAADALEFALRSGESAADAEVRGALARIWTLFVPAYEAVARESPDRFPPLAVVAARRRARKKPVSVVPPPVISAPPAAAARAIESRATLEVVQSEPPPRARSSPDPLGQRRSWVESRRARRAIVEIEVGIASDSNLYVGFTENVSATGVFIATYAERPIGAKIEVYIAFPDGEELCIPGVVKWLRDASCEGWPGFGVEFESLSADDEEKLREFVALRAPLFYPD